jgi:aspartyl/glutamyl-tRNA(Asn/Gln) amidotransferase C subunit
MSLKLAEVEHIAELARLELTDTEKNLYRQQLSAILDYAAILQQCDTSAISPTACGPIAWSLRCRARTCSPMPRMPTKAASACAPSLSPADEDRNLLEPPSS